MVVRRSGASRLRPNRFRLYIKVQALDMFHTSARPEYPRTFFRQEPCVRHEVFEKEVALTSVSSQALLNPIHLHK